MLLVRHKTPTLLNWLINDVPSLRVWGLAIGRIAGDAGAGADACEDPAIHAAAWLMRTQRSHGRVLLHAACARLHCWHAADTCTLLRLGSPCVGFIVLMLFVGGGEKMVFVGYPMLFMMSVFWVMVLCNNVTIWKNRPDFVDQVSEEGKEKKEKKEKEEEEERRWTITKTSDQPNQKNYTQTTTDFRVNI